jgi:hypothetical protein
MVASSNNRGAPGMTPRAAQASSQLQSEFCMFVLYCVAPVKADSGASNHASLGRSRAPSFHFSRSMRRATVNTFSLSGLALSFTSPHLTKIARRVGFDSTNQRRTALEPSRIFDARRSKCGWSNRPASSPILIAKIWECASSSNTFVNTGNWNKHVMPCMSSTYTCFVWRQTLKIRGHDSYWLLPSY